MTLTVDRLKPAADLPRPPRAMAWVLLMASAGAVLLSGVLGTALILSDTAAPSEAVGVRYWVALLAGSLLTIASLALRSLRWIFLLRRTGVRIPIRDAYIGYFAGLSLLFAPFLLGEIAVRAMIHRRRGGVPVATTVVVNLWERGLDLVALGLVAGLLAIALGRVDRWSVGLLLAALTTAIPAARRLYLQGMLALVRPVARVLGGELVGFERLAAGKTWLAATAVSVVAWTLPGLALWLLVRAWGHPYGVLRAEHLYTSASAAGGLLLAPGGVVVVGQRFLQDLVGDGLAPTLAALSVLGIRVATVGVATVLGVLFVAIHWRSAPAETESHFDAIADAYDVQIPPARRQGLLTRKTMMMRALLDRLGAGRRGLDVGCGQGAYVARMRELGFEVTGIDASTAQVQLAARTIGAPDIVRVGSVTSITAADASYDFAYVINVLHHLSSVEEQRRAFAELFRVLRPGGVLFVHEINTTNILFRFYMGYVFPSLNCIDEGVERWLLPDRLALYTDEPVIETEYFTFLPEFLPGPIVRGLAPLERLLEASRLRVFSAHYMAVLRKRG